MSTYKTLGGKSLSELPQIPTELTSSKIQGGFEITWVNNNTNVTGTTNVIQVWYNSEWNDSGEVAASATTITVSGLSELTYYNVRIAVKTTEDRFYPSIVYSFETDESPYPTSGLIGRYLFEDDLTNSFTSGGGSTLEIHAGTTTYITGKIGKGVDIYNSVDYISLFSTDSSILDVLKNTNSFTISFWFNVSSNRQSNATFKFSSGQRFGYSAEFGNYYKRDGSSDGSRNIATANVWKQHILTFNGTQTKHYIDNVLLQTINETTSITLTEIAFMYFLTTSGNQHLKADLLYIYNKELTDYERGRLWNGGAGI